ncbi:membrane hypothetical protein [Gammaproteobacteria bacterium]
MRRFAIIALIGLIGFAPSLVSAANTPKQATKQSEVLIENKPADQIYPIVLAAGALAGVVSVNWLTYGVGTLPLSVGIETTAPVVSPAAAAASRIFVITSGVIGAWIADLLYQ